MVGVLPATLVASREVQLPGLRELLAGDTTDQRPNGVALGAPVLDALPAVEAEVQGEGHAVLDRKRLATR